MLQFAHGVLTYAQRRWNTPSNDSVEAFFRLVTHVNEEGLSRYAICTSTKPLRVFLQCTALVLPSFRGGDGKLRYGRSLLAVLHLRITTEISNQQNLLHGIKPPY